MASQRSGSTKRLTETVRSLKGPGDTGVDTPVSAPGTTSLRPVDYREVRPGPRVTCATTPPETKDLSRTTPVAGTTNVKGFIRPHRGRPLCLPLLIRPLVICDILHSSSLNPPFSPIPLLDPFLVESFRTREGLSPGPRDLRLRS